MVEATSLADRLFRRRAKSGPSSAPLRFRRGFCRLVHAPVYTFVWLALKLAGQYRIERIDYIRRQYATLASEPGPLLIYANHLTFIDSIIIVWALGSARWYARNFSRLSWNIPAEDVFGQRLRFRIFAALTKCIFVDRKGPAARKRALVETCRRLVAAGEVITIFPEGKRSRSGVFEIDKLSRGVGKIVASMPTCRVLCIYVRGDMQAGYSDYPPRGSVFHLRMKVVNFAVQQDNGASWRAITQQLGRIIKDFENEHLNAIKRRNAA